MATVCAEVVIIKKPTMRTMKRKIGFALYLRRRDSCITDPNRDDVPRNVGKAFGALCGIVGALSLVINKCVTRPARIEVTGDRPL